MYIAKLVAFAIILTRVSVADTPPADWKIALEKHNYYRCLHGVSDLQWDTTIANKAQEWTDKMQGKMQHSTFSFRQNVAGFGYLGENLAKFASKEGAVKMWYDEIKDTPGGQGRETTFKAITGHYTQVVWKGSTKLGCGETKGMVCCMYGIGGNMHGQFETNVLPVDLSKESKCKTKDPSGGNPSGGNPNGGSPSGGKREHFLNKCEQCLYSYQCLEGSFCCPFMKKCIPTSTTSCNLPIANCRPICFDTSNGYPSNCKCKNPDFPNNWVKGDSENPTNAPKINCEGKWSEWSVCSSSCGGGTQTKTYTIQTEANGGETCPAKNNEIQTQACKLSECPVESDCANLKDKQNGNACRRWADSGFCEPNSRYAPFMQENCSWSCKKCENPRIDVTTKNFVKVSTAGAECSSIGQPKIKTASECQNAASVLGINWNPCCQNIDNEPYGCIYRGPDKDILFNGKVDASTQWASRNNRYEICGAKEESKEEDVSVLNQDRSLDDLINL